MAVVTIHARRNVLVLRHQRTKNKILGLKKLLFLTKKFGRISILFANNYSQIFRLLLTGYGVE